MKKKNTQCKKKRLQKDRPLPWMFCFSLLPLDVAHIHVICDHFSFAEFHVVETFQCYFQNNLSVVRLNWVVTFISDIDGTLNTWRCLLL